MKFIIIPTIALITFLLSSCSTTQQYQDEYGDYNTQPWNRPQAWEGSRGFGSQFPQSR